MKTPWWTVVTILILWAMSVRDIACAAEDFSLGLPGNVPFTGLDGARVTGVIAEATVAALEAMGRKVVPRSVPFKRMYQWVHEGQLDVAVSVLRTPERAGLAHYSDPIVTEYTLIMVPKGRTFPLSHVTELQGKKLGAQLGFVYPQLDDVKVELIYEKDYETNIRKIAAGKIDGALIGSITGPFLARGLGLLDEVTFLPGAVGAVPLGAAFSKLTFTEADLTAFNAAIKHLQARPQWYEILSANGVAELVKAWPVVPR